MTSLDAAKLAWIHLHAALVLGGASPNPDHLASVTDTLRMAVDLLSTPDRIAFNKWADAQSDALLSVLQRSANEVRGVAN